MEHADLEACVVSRQSCHSCVYEEKQPEESHIWVAEAHEPLEAGTPPDGHPLPVEGCNIAAMWRPLHKELCPAVALVDRLWLTPLGVVEEDLGVVLVADYELVPASPIHTPLMQIFLYFQAGFRVFSKRPNQVDWGSRMCI